MAHSTEGGLAVVADHLKDQMFSSTTVVAIDSIIVTSLFGQRTRKKSKRTHGLQTLSIACNVDQKTKDTIYQTFESSKGQLLFEYPKAYLRAANTMAASLYRGCSPLKQHGSDSRAVVEWCIAAYAMVINAKSCVKLSCAAMGPTWTLGFAVHAATNMAKGHEIRELAGLMPKDGRAKHSEVSCIRPASDQNQSGRVERVLFGPIRFINHVCETPNAEFIAITNSSSFFVVASRDIAVGEELFVDYGKDWFSGEPGGCPCKTCKPDQQVKKRQLEDKDEATIEAEKREARRAKRKRTKDKKSAQRADEAGPH